MQGNNNAKRHGFPAAFCDDDGRRVSETDWKKEEDQEPSLVSIKQICREAMEEREKEQLIGAAARTNTPELEEKEWVLSIKGMLDACLCGPWDSSPSIFMASSPLRSLKHDAFVPQVVAIGPYHSDLGPHHSSFPDNQETERYKAVAAKEMEKHKVMACAFVAKSLPSGNFSLLTNRFLSIIQKVRAEYDTEISCQTDDKLAYMLALDASFVVEVLKSSAQENGSTIPSGYASYYNLRFPRPLRKSILQDFVLLENQIPMFLLLEVIRISMIKDNNAQDSSAEALKVLGKLVTKVACEVLPFYYSSEESFHVVVNDIHSRKHLLDCLYGIATQGSQTQKLVEKPTHFPSAVDLHNCGIKFQPVGPGYMNSVSFDAKKAILYLPKIRVGDDTERLFRNLIAYESHLADNVYVLSYLRFMNNLVDSAADVDLLVGKGVIAQDIGSNEEVAHMWNKLCVNTMRVCSHEYEQVALQLTDHCQYKLNALKAEFKRTYLSRPWLMISVLSGGALLVMTFIIMYYTIKLYLKPGG